MIRSMPDPKPIVVAMAWVVECAEKQAHADETKHIVDLSEVNIAGINKVRLFDWSIALHRMLTTFA
jgi:hypothetical protein